MSELALVEQSNAVEVGRWAETLVFATKLAEYVNDTEFVPRALRGRPEAVAATIMYGAEVGVTPMQALAGIHIVDGRPAPSAELMRAMILRAGHTLTVHDMSGTRARVSGLRRGRPESERVVVEWTVDQARAAGLLGKQNWQRYPRAMLLARATGDLARLLFADVVKGLGYVAEDDSAVEAWGVEVDSAPPPEEPRRKPLQRRRKPVSPPPVSDVALPAGGAADREPTRPPIAPMEPVRHADEMPVADGGETPRRREPVDEEPPPSPYADPQVREQILRETLEADPTERPSDPAPAFADDDDPLPDEFTESLRLPDPQPEQKPDEPPAPNTPPVTIAARPLKALQTGLTRELGTVATREERHALVEAILGHPIDSTKTLHRADGYRVLDYLDRFADGTASWAFNNPLDPAQGIVVHDLREPPPDE